MIPYADALRIILDYSTRELPVETVPLVLAAGRVLASAVIAEENIPSAANSAMDGYAVRAEDTLGATVESPAQFHVIGEAAAGSAFRGMLGKGDAVRIMTGGLIPEGADAVIEVESTFEADGILEARRSVSPAEAIRNAGEDIAAGEEAIAGGKRLGPGDIGVLASLGVTNVPVRVKPIVGILSTGNEIVEAFRSPQPGQLRNSTSPALYAGVVESGGEPIDLGIAGDSVDELEEKIEEGLRYDILLTTGGVSAGRYDLVQRIFPQLGVEIRFHKVKIRPGKPLLFGTYGDGAHRTLVFGLPGNPVSTLVTFRQFVLPAIGALLGSTHTPLRVRARLEHPLHKTRGTYNFIRGIVRAGADGELRVTTTGTQSSGVLTSMSRGNCLIFLDESTESLEIDTWVDIELL